MSLEGGETFNSSRTISLKPPIMSASAIENACLFNGYTTDSTRYPT
jgi:hypothetical protein